MNKFTDPPNPPGTWVQRIRPEGRVREMSWLERAGYLCKYLITPKLSAPDSIVQHFLEQKRLHAYLRSRPKEEVALTRLAFAGDLMWIRSHWNTFLSASALEKLREFDGIVANLETLISPRFPVIDYLPDILRFNSHRGLLTSFQNKNGQSLFAALSVANNHSLDLGDEALLDTMDLLDEEGICHSGAREHSAAPAWQTFERGQIRFGFFAAGFGMNDPRLVDQTQLKLNILPGLAPAQEEPNLSEAKKALREMREAKIEVKIIFLHWGSEFEFYPTAQAMNVARELVEEGADFVVGSHPHVPQPMELIFVNGQEKTLPAAAVKQLKSLQPEGNSLLTSEIGGERMACILYSMGNFTTAMYTFFCRTGLLAGVNFYRDKATGRVLWDVPEFSFFHNLPPKIGRGRQLIPLTDSWMPSPDSRRRFAFLQSHLMLQKEQEWKAMGELPL